MPPGLRRELARLTVGPWSPHQSALDRLREAAWRLVDWRDFAAPWRRPEFDRETELEELCAGVERLGELVLHGRRSDMLRRGLTPVVELSNWIVRTRQLGGAGPGPNGGDRADGQEAFQDQLEARLVKLLRDLSGFRSPRKGRGGFAEGVAREQVFELWRRLLERLRARFEQTGNADLAALLKDELSVAVERYEHAKRLLGKLDFHDLLIKARDLLRRDREVRRHLQARYRHLFIDEFQDTDPLQAEIPVAALGRRPGPGRLDAGRSGCRQAVPCRRSEAVDLPFPPGRCRALPGGQGETRGARCRGPAPCDQFPVRGADPAAGQRGLRATHDR